MPTTNQKRRGRPPRQKEARGQQPEVFGSRRNQEGRHTPTPREESGFLDPQEIATASQGTQPETTPPKPVFEPPQPVPEQHQPLNADDPQFQQHAGLEKMSARKGTRTRKRTLLSRLNKTVTNPATSTFGTTTQMRNIKKTRDLSLSTDGTGRSHLYPMVRDTFGKVQMTTMARRHEDTYEGKKKKPWRAKDKGLRDAI